MDVVCAVELGIGSRKQAASVGFRPGTVSLTPIFACLVFLSLSLLHVVVASLTLCVLSSFDCLESAANDWLL